MLRGRVQRWSAALVIADRYTIYGLLVDVRGRTVVEYRRRRDRRLANSRSNVPRRPLIACLSRHRCGRRWIFHVDLGVVTGDAYARSGVLLFEPGQRRTPSQLGIGRSAKR